VTLVVWLREAAETPVTLIGGKAESLGRLLADDLNVPDGYVLTTEAYLASRDAAGRTGDMADLLHEAHGHDLDALAEACASVREIVRTVPLAPHVEESVRGAYRTLAERRRDPRLPVAVRSSAVGEDSAEASFAGEHDTYLWVRGDDAVVDAVRCCWASLFTDRAVSYRAEMGLDHLSVAMGVVVQEMVRPTSAGVAFTLNPSDGDRSVVAIDSSWGFGEAVVAGEVTPDSFIIDKVMRTMVSRVVSNKEHELVLGPDDRLVSAPVSDERRNLASLTDDQALEVARLARIVERRAGCPQDVEWALVDDAAGGWSVVLLQTRPETVWSRLDSGFVPDGAPGDQLSSIVSTLVSPLHRQSES
jgi:pyruvate,water dikinase